MNILLVYPSFPDTFWSFNHALKFISKKASFPPLGLLTIAAMLPQNWNKKLIDLNVEKLKDKDLLWADYIFISAMSIQKQSVLEIIIRSKNLNKKIVAGGPLFTSCPEDFESIDHLVLNEAEITLPEFLKDVAIGNPRHKYTTDKWADITTTPIPLWQLIKGKKYSSMNIQYSRGCPFDCDFCDITVLYGRKPRTKTKEQIISELDSLYSIGWRSSIFFVDDNFIGNKSKLKNEILPTITNWMQKRHKPFNLFTESSINLADDDMLLRQMIDAGFETVFVGIESTNEECLIECNKIQNCKRDMFDSINKIQRAGLEVQGGFIVGFDNDNHTIFEKLSNFIQKSGIVTAMVGLLNAPRGTKLYKKLESEGRLINEFKGNNTDSTMNFHPKMNMERLITGYKNILDTIYAPKNYNERVKKFLKNFKPSKKPFRLRPIHLVAFIRSIFRLGIIDKERKYYWKLFFWSLLHKPQMFPVAITFSIYGFHFRKVKSSFKSLS